jgi:hypothetical protein
MKRAEGLTGILRHQPGCQPPRAPSWRTFLLAVLPGGGPSEPQPRGAATTDRLDEVDTGDGRAGVGVVGGGGWWGG